MSTFPALSPNQDARRRIRENKRSDVSTSNRVRSQILGATAYDFENLVFDVTEDGRTAINSHYASNKYASFKFQWTDGVLYDVQYKDGAEPQEIPMAGGWYKVSLSLIGDQP